MTYLNTPAFVVQLWLLMFVYREFPGEQVNWFHLFWIRLDCFFLLKEDITIEVFVDDIIEVYCYRMCLMERFIPRRT